MIKPNCGSYQSSNIRPNSLIISTLSNHLATPQIQIIPLIIRPQLHNRHVISVHREEVLLVVAGDGGQGAVAGEAPGLQVGVQVFEFADIIKGGEHILNPSNILGDAHITTLELGNHGQNFCEHGVT